MREARFGDVWRHLANKKHDQLPKLIDLTAHDLLPPSISLSFPVTVLAGLNGSGKTRLLRALADDLDASNFVNVSLLCDWMVRELAQRSDLADMRDEVEPQQLDQRTIDAVNAVVGRKYSSIKWYSLDMADSPFAPILGEEAAPYFEVEYAGSEYSIAEMGLGELSAHVLMWLLSNLSRSPGSAMLLDEPDAFLPPVARTALLNYLALAAKDDKHIFVVASHSREFISTAASYDGSLAVLSRQEASTSLVTRGEEVREIVRGILYREEGVKLVVFVEDEAATILAGELLRIVDVDLWRQTAIYWARGTGTVTLLSERLPRPPRAVRGLEFLLLVDGDSSDKVSIAPGKWPIVALPGGSDPDELFSTHCPSAVPRMAAALGKPEGVVSVLLDTLSGSDKHDWTNAFLASADVERQVGLRALCHGLLESSVGPSLIEDFKAVLANTGLRAFDRLSEG